MVGQLDRPGIMILTLNEVFSEIEKNRKFKEITAKVSYLEVYNETIRDLLTSDETNLDLREDPGKGISVAGLTEFEINSTQDVLQILKLLFSLKNC